MNVTLTPEVERLVAESLDSGRYQSASEVIREGLLLLRERHELMRREEELRLAIKAGIDELDRGEGVPLDDAEVARIKAEGRKLLQARRANGHESTQS
jgi:antitoxin ParD1/3/4